MPAAKNLLRQNEWSIDFQSLQKSIDTTTSNGKLIFHTFGALAEFKRNLIRERAKASLAATRARGKKGGDAKHSERIKRSVFTNFTMKQMLMEAGNTPSKRFAR